MYNCKNNKNMYRNDQVGKHTCARNRFGLFEWNAIQTFLLASTGTNNAMLPALKFIKDIFNSSSSTSVG